MKIQEILRLYSLGMSNKQIARSCNCSRTTVIEMLKRADEVALSWPEAEAMNMEVVNQLTGEKSRVYLFVCALEVSDYPSAEALFNISIASWTAAHMHMFEYYCCSLRILVSNNLRTGVEKAHIYNPVENRSYWEMAEHYTTAIVSARICRPKDKTKAKNAEGDIETWVMAELRNRTFFSLSELNVAILERMKAFSAKPFQKRFGSWDSVSLEEDKPELTALPTNGYGLGVKHDLRMSSKHMLCSIIIAAPYIISDMQLPHRCTPNA